VLLAEIMPRLVELAIMLFELAVAIVIVVLINIIERFS
jgi:hypothetical protein